MRKRQPKQTAKPIEGVQLSLPLDVDQLAVAVGAGIDLDPHLPHIRAYREGKTVVLKAGLSRADERMYGAHELGHVAADSADVEAIDCGDRHVLKIEERRADRFRNDTVAPYHVLLDRLQDGATQEDLCFEFGLTLDHLMTVMKQHEKRQNRGWL